MSNKFLKSTKSVWRIRMKKVKFFRNFIFIILFIGLTYNYLYSAKYPTNLRQFKCNGFAHNKLQGTANQNTCNAAPVANNITFDNLMEHGNVGCDSISYQVQLQKMMVSGGNCTTTLSSTIWDSGSSNADCNGCTGSPCAGCKDAGCTGCVEQFWTRYKYDKRTVSETAAGTYCYRVRVILAGSNYEDYYWKINVASSYILRSFMLQGFVHSGTDGGVTQAVVPVNQAVYFNNTYEDGTHSCDGSSNQVKLELHRDCDSSYNNCTLLDSCTGPASDSMGQTMGCTKITSRTFTSVGTYYYKILVYRGATLRGTYKWEISAANPSSNKSLTCNGGGINYGYSTEPTDCYDSAANYDYYFTSNYTNTSPGCQNQLVTRLYDCGTDSSCSSPTLITSGTQLDQQNLADPTATINNYYKGYAGTGGLYFWQIRNYYNGGSNPDGTYTFRLRSCASGKYCCNKHSDCRTYWGLGNTYYCSSAWACEVLPNTNGISCQKPAGDINNGIGITNVTAYRVFQTSTLTEVDATGTSTACDGSVDYYGTNGQCTYSRRYAECNGSGSCDTNSATYYQGYTNNVSSYKVAITQSGGSTVPQGDATSTSLACDASVDYYATGGQCTYSRRYAECNGSGSCDTNSATYYQGYTDVVPADKVAYTQSGGNTTPYGDATASYYCAVTCTGGANSACTFEGEECDGTGICTTDYGTAGLAIPSSKVCTGNAIGESNASNYCGVSCTGGACTFTALECGGSGSCGSTGNSANIPASKVCTNNSIGDATASYYCAVTCTGGANSACTFEGEECDGAGACTTANGTTGLAIPSSKVCTGNAIGESNASNYCGVSCTGGAGSACTFTALECGGAGSCGAAGNSANIPNGQVCTGNALGSPSTTNYCQYAEDCDAGDCSATKYYRACGGAGSCRTDNTGAATQGVVADTGYTLNDDCSTNGTTFCGYGSWSCTDIFWRRRDQYRCNASQVCNYDVGDENQNCNATQYYYCSGGNCVEDTAAPTCTLNNISETASGSYIFVSGSTVYYNSSQSGRFSVNVTSSDTQSGVQKINYPALSTLVGSGDDTTSPYQSNDANQAYGFTSSSTYNGAASFTCYDYVGRTASNTYTITRDSNNPVYDSGSLVLSGCAYVNGNDCWEPANSNFTIDIRHTDANAGDSGPDTQYLSFTAGCTPNACGGAPREIKSYINVDTAPAGFTDWMANDSYLNITGGTCTEAGGCTGSAAKIQWAVTTGNASEAVYLIYTFMYDEVWRGVGYTSTGKYLKIDFTPPTGGSISYTNGDDPSPVTLTLSAGSDSKSGVKTGAGSATIERRSVAVNSDGTCPTTGWSAWAILTTIDSLSSSYDDGSVSGGNCYQYRYIVQDNVGNSTTYTSNNTAIVPGSPNKLEISGGTVVASGEVLISGWTTCGSAYCSKVLNYKPSTVLYGTTYLKNIDDNGNPTTGQWAWDTTNKMVKIADNPASASVSYDSLLVRINLFDPNYIFTSNDSVGVQLEWSGDNDFNISSKTIIANTIGGSNGGNTTSGNLSLGKGTFTLTAIAGSSASTGSFKMRICYPNCTSPTIQSSATVYVQKPTKIYLPISDVSDSGVAPTSNQTFFSLAYSPDGSKLAFIASGTTSCGTGSETSWNLYVKQVSGGSTCKRLTNNAQKLLPVSDVSFGTDNDTVYYARLTGAKTVNIWSVTFSTVASATVTNASANEGYYDPDVCSSGADAGKIVAVKSTSSGNSIVVLTGGSVSKTLIDGSSMFGKNVVLKPKWSPDCTKVAVAMWDEEEDSSSSPPSNTGVYVLSNLTAVNALDYTKLNNCQNNGKDETSGYIYCLRISDYKNNGVGGGTGYSAFFPNWTKDNLGVIYSLDKGNGFDIYHYVNWSDMTGYQFGTGKTTNFDSYIQYIGDTTLPPYAVTAKSSYSEYAMVQNKNDGKLAFISKEVAGGPVTEKQTATLEILTLSNEATISSTGGILFFNGMITAVFPAGVTKTDQVRIQVTNPSGTPSADTYDRMVSTGEARQFAPGGIKFDSDIRLIFYYNDVDGDGIVDGTSFDERKLHVYYYCTSSAVGKGYCSSSGSWVRYDGINDPNSNTITVFTNHFSRYDLFAVRSGLVPSEFTPLKIDNLHTYPNPWMPGLAGEITFNADNVEYTQGQMLKVNIEIYDIRGKLVRSIVNVISGEAGIQPGVFGGIDLAKWNIRNNAGKQVASGVYFYVLRATDGITSKTIKGKIGIVR